MKNIIASLVLAFSLLTVSAGEGRITYLQTSSGGSVISVTGTPGNQYSIEASTNLLDWYSLSSVQTADSNGNCIFLYAAYTPELGVLVAPTNRCFYRSVQVSSPLIVSRHASSPIAAVVCADQTVTTLAIKFSAIENGCDVADLTVTLGTNAFTVVESVMLYDGATLIAQVPMSTMTSATFSGLNWNIPANTSKTLTVKVQLGYIGLGAGTSGASVLTTLTSFSAIDTSTGIRTSTGTNIAGAEIRVMKSLPTINYEPLPVTSLVAGEQALLQFSITADNAGPVSIATLSAFLHFYGVTVSNCNIYLSGFGAPIKLMAMDSNPYVPNATIVRVNVENASGVPTPLQIPAGVTYHFELRGTVTPIAGGNEALIVTRLLGDTPMSSITMDTWQNIVTAIVQPPNDSNALIWSPNTLGTSSLTDPDWTNGYGLLGLPEEGITQIVNNWP